MIRRYPLAAYFTLACGFSWIVWAPLWLPAFGINTLPKIPYQHAFGAAGPFAAAFIVSGAESGVPGVSDLWRRMSLWRGRLTTVAIACLGPVVLLALSSGVAWLIDRNAPSMSWTGRSREFPQFSALGFLIYSIVSFGYGEEVGWRGFALPRLQSRHSALVAAALLTIGWAVWHTPLFFYRPGYTGMNAVGIAGWLFSLLTGSVLLTWLYNGSRGSLLVVAIFHAAIDVVFTSGSQTPMAVNVAGALISVWGVIVVGSAGPAYLSRCGKMVQQDRAGVTVFRRRTARIDPAGGSQRSPDPKRRIADDDRGGCANEAV